MTFCPKCNAGNDKGGLGADQSLHQGTYTRNCAMSLTRRKMLRLLLPGLLLEFAMLGRVQACGPTYRRRSPLTLGAVLYPCIRPRLARIFHEQ